MSDMNESIPNAVDDTRRARDEITQGGFASLREHLRRVREQRRTKSGPFAGIPDEQPEDVRRIIDAAKVLPPLDLPPGSRKVRGEPGRGMEQRSM